MIRWKLFALTCIAVAVPAIGLTGYFAWREVVELDAALRTKALSFARILARESEPAVAFDDATTAGETFGAVATDTDVVHLVLFRSDGSVIESRGEGDESPPIAPPAPVATSVHGRIRVVAPVVSVEGPTGTLVVELGTSAADAASSRAWTSGLVVGLAALALGCLVAWLVGTSFGRRLRRVEARALRIAAGDLGDAPLADVSRDEIGSVARAFQAMAIVVEAKVAERTAALAASREQLRSLLETTRTVPWSVGPGAARLDYIGPQAEALLGAPVETILTADFFATRVSAEHLREASAAMDATRQDGKDREVELRFRCDDGRELWLRSSMGMMQTAAGRATCGFLTDVTERRRLERDLQQAQKLESVGRLAAGVAHEINTPIQFVTDSTFFVKESLDQFVPLVVKYREASPHDRRPRRGRARRAPRHRRGGRRPRLRRRARAYRARPDPRGPRSCRDDCPLDEGIRAPGLARSQLRGPERGAAEHADGRAWRVQVRRGRRDGLRRAPRPSPATSGELNQAFLNVIVNAAHAIGEVNAGTDRRGMIRVWTREEAGHAVVRISDTGGGIPESIRSKVFDPFFTTKEVGRGTGQGLAIARSVVVATHGGTIDFEVEPGVGTTFVIRIPTGEPSAVVLAA